MSNRRKLKPAAKPRDLGSQESQELWEKACQLFPDPLEDKVIALAEQEGVQWQRVPAYGLHFVYQDKEQAARFEAGMAQLGQRLD